MRLVLAFVCVTCIATIGGCLLMRGSDGVLDASWTAPTTNADGSSLKDLASYRVYYSTTKTPCPGGRFLTVASSTASPAANQTVGVRLTGLTVGRLYYVAITTVNSRGGVSGCSIVASARARLP